MGAHSKAWLLTPYGVQPFAVAGHEIVEYLNVAQLHAVPLAPPHCRAVLFWRNRIVPLLDFGPLNGLCRTAATSSVAVLAYQAAPGTPLDYIAIALREPPVRIVVDDETACGLPQEQAALWRLLATSCFAREGIATPIISVARLNSVELRLYVEDNVADMDEETLSVAQAHDSRIASGSSVINKAVSGNAPSTTARAAGGVDAETDADDEFEDEEPDADAEWEDDDDLIDATEDEDEDEETDALDDLDADLDFAFGADANLEDDASDAENGWDDLGDDVEDGDESVDALDDLDADLDAAFDADDALEDDDPDTDAGWNDDEDLDEDLNDDRDRAGANRTVSKLPKG